MTELSNSDLKSFVNRIVDRETEKAEIADDIRSIYAEAKSAGYDPAAVRIVVKEKLEDYDKRKKREAREEIVTIYRTQLGLPL